LNRRGALRLEAKQAVGAIASDELAPTLAGEVTFSVTTDWNSGFTGEIRIHNTSDSAMANWQLAFEFTGNISSFWNGQAVSHVGDRYVVKNADYNSTIAAGATATFGLVGSRASAAVVPTNFVLSGGPVDRA
jgi:cellulase/cellobiase CelA1